MINSFISNSFVDTTDNLYPNKDDILTDSLPVSNVDGCNKLFIAYKESITILDRGFLFQDSSKDKKLIISIYIPDGVQETTERLGAYVIYWVEIFADHTSSTTYIKYMKIQDVLANLGGVISFLKGFFYFFFLFINHYNVAFTLFDETYNNPKLYCTGNKQTNVNESSGQDSSFSFDNKKLRKLTKLRPVKIHNTTTSHLNINTNNNTTPHFHLKPANDRIVITKTRIPKLESFKLGIYYYLCSRNKKTVTYKANNLIVNKINKELDVSNYLRIKEEILMMRSLVFRDEEKDLFLPKSNFEEILFSVSDNFVLNSAPYYDYLRSSFSIENRKEIAPDIKNKIMKVIQSRFKIV